MTDDEDVEQRGGPPCPRCEQPLFRRHCKYVCPQHGVVYDCSDPFWQ
ncbi:HVO_2523 family zinc finger protein [Halosolutus halophilus]|nr:HVO_2523 family zinc finger protein [Halosolutus halophilus]